MALRQKLLGFCVPFPSTERSDFVSAGPAPHIAVVDDEVDITVLLAGYLSQHGFRVSQLHSGSELLALMAVDPAALVLLDLGLGAEDGLALARDIRLRWRCGVVILTGRSDAIDKVVGLELGADDYVTKPFELRELVARVKAVLRRIDPAEGSPVAQPVPSPRLRFDRWILDLPGRRLFDDAGTEVTLTGGEFDLLATFVEHPGRVLSRDFLLEATRGREAGPFDRTIDVQVGRLRKKLEEEAENPQIIKSVRGAGYVLMAAVSPASSGTHA